jgi:hypothetical protein
MGKREEYQTFMEKQLNEWKSKTDPLKVAAGQWEAQAKAQYEKNLELLKAQREEAWSNLSKMKSAGDDAWEQLKVQTDKAWEDLKSTTEKLTSQAKK